VRAYSSRGEFTSIFSWNIVLAIWYCFVPACLGWVLLLLMQTGQLHHQPCHLVPHGPCEHHAAKLKLLSSEDLSARNAC